MIESNVFAKYCTRSETNALVGFYTFLQYLNRRLTMSEVANDYLFFLN